MFTTTTREMQEILAIDPLAGDTACQNRAIYLACLARKVRRNKPLNPEELDFIENCRILSEAKDIRRDAFGIITTQRGKPLEKIDAVVFPDNGECSNTKKNAFLAEKKKAVAVASLNFMMRKSQQMTFFSPLPRAEDAPSTLPINGVRIPVFPFYLAVKMMLNIVNRKAIDIVAVITRVQENGENRVLLGNAMVLYTKRDGQYSPTRLNETEGEASLIKEAIKIEFVSKVKCDEGLSKDNADTTLSFEAYLAKFMEKDILQQILLYGGNHSVYPSRTKSPEDDVFLRDLGPLEETKLFDLNQCSLYEYRELKRLADAAPISRDGDFVDHISVTARSLS